MYTFQKKKSFLFWDIHFPFIDLKKNSCRYKTIDFLKSQKCTFLTQICSTILNFIQAQSIMQFPKCNSLHLQYSPNWLCSSENYVSHWALKIEKMVRKQYDFNNNYALFLKFQPTGSSENYMLVLTFFILQNVHVFFVNDHTAIALVIWVTENEK